MSNGEMNVFERLWKLWATVCKLILDKKRDPEFVADMLQPIVTQTDEWKGLTCLDKPTTLQTGDLLCFRKIDGCLSISRAGKGSLRFGGSTDNTRSTVSSLRPIDEYIAFSCAVTIGTIVGLRVKKEKEISTGENYAFRLV